MTKLTKDIYRKGIDILKHDASDNNILAIEMRVQDLDIAPLLLPQQLGIALIMNNSLHDPPRNNL